MALVIILALLIPAVLLRAWVITWLWLWFIVPLGAPLIGMAWAVGISSFMALFQNAANTTPKDTDPWEALGRSLTHIFIAPLVMLSIGWVSHLAMAA